MEIKQKFNLTEKAFYELNKKSTEFVKGFWNGNMSPDTKELYSYLEKLDNTCDEYLQFGADKAGVNNFDEFIEILGVEVKTPQKENGRFHFYSSDRTVSFSCSSSQYEAGYFHYFGITGQRSKILQAFSEFMKQGYWFELTYGQRDFI
jgi:hypothetical protein